MKHPLRSQGPREGLRATEACANVVISNQVYLLQAPNTSCLKRDLP